MPIIETPVGLGHTILHVFCFAMRTNQRDQRVEPVSWVGAVILLSLRSPRKYHGYSHPGKRLQGADHLTSRAESDAFVFDFSCLFLSVSTDSSTLG